MIAPAVVSISALVLCAAAEPEAAAVAASSAPPSDAPSSVGVDARYARTAVLLSAFADQAREKRVALAVGSGTLAAGLIGAGITYVAVSGLDGALNARDETDTQVAGLVIASAAVVPLAVGAGYLIVPSDEEERLVLLELAASKGAADKAKAVDDAIAALKGAEEGAGRAVAGTALVGTGVVSFGLGILFTLFPHIPATHTGVVSHGTGAELVGVGVSSMGVGGSLFFLGGGSSEIALELLQTDPVVGAASTRSTE